MQYKLLYQHNGIIRSKAEPLNGNKLTVEFIGIKEGMTAVFCRDDGEQLYKKLNDEGRCEIDKSYLKVGRINCSVCIFDTKKKPETWVCQPFIVERTAVGVYAIKPDDEELNEIVDNLQCLISEQAKLVNVLTKRIVELENKVKKLSSGYDVI